LIAILVFALLAGIGAGELFRLTMEADHLATFYERAKREATLLMGQTLGGREMGAVALSAATDPQLLAAATATEPSRRDRSDDAARPLEILGHTINGDGAFVVNRAGIIVASWDEQGRPRIGSDLSFRPNIQTALNGIENVYAAVGTSTGDRALYFTAPIRSNQDGQTAVVGALVGRIGVGSLDLFLRDWSGVALLLSPQGVVFSSSRRDWLLSLAGDASPDRIRAIAAQRQFGSAFDGPHRIRTLPFAPDSASLSIDQTRYSATRLPLKWNDPGGDWSLVLLTDLSSATPVAARIAIGLLTAFGTTTFGLLLRGARGRASDQRQAESARDEAARWQAADTERQTRRSDLFARLHEATTVAELAEELFAVLARDLPLDQGSLYVSEDDEHRFCLAGCHGGGVPQQVRRSDSMIGECARLGRALCLENPPAGVWRIRLEQKDVSPRALLLLPLVRGDRVLGILQLASLSSALIEHRAEAEAVLPVLALKIDVLLMAKQAQSHRDEALRLADAVRFQQDLGQRTEDWFRTILDGMPVGILVIDPSGRIILSNREIEFLSGYSLDELMGAEIERLVPSAIRDHHVEWRQSLTMCEDQIVRMGSEHPALPLVTRDGTERMVEISLTKTPALGPQPPCICAMIRPVKRYTPPDRDMGRNPG